MDRADDLYVRVALDQPIPALFDYRYRPEQFGGVIPVPGTLVWVPFGKRRNAGIVWAVVAQTEVPLKRLKSVEALCDDCPPLGADWRALIAFAAGYYQRGIGEVALPALPQGLRDPSRWGHLLPREIVYALRGDVPEAYARLDADVPKRAAALRRLVEALALGPLSLPTARRLHPRAAAQLDAWCASGLLRRDEVDINAGAGLSAAGDAVPATRILSAEQQEAVTQIDAASLAGGFAPFLLHGVTGSGKTEVYLQTLSHLLARAPQAQALVLVPEINLTPQFDALFRRRFAHLGDGAVATLHSGLADGERTRHWLAAHLGRARIVLGTRLAVMASFTRLAMIVVDEEHEAAYKQQEGLRYSARDLAVWRAKQLGVPIVLGSATPSLESWSQAEQGRYRRLSMTTRPATAARAAQVVIAPPDAAPTANAPTDAAPRDAAPPDAAPGVPQPHVLPRVTLIDTELERQRKRPSIDGFSAPLVAALRKRLEQGEQSLVFLNRRGYAPVLSCDSCGWVSGCPRCSAYLVLHKLDRALRCHHCGWQQRIPPACPECGNVDIAPMGRGTQRAEETLAELVPGARVLRIDADSTRKKGSAAALFANVHAGDVDILVGTHMIAKGHDFQRVSLVGVLNADSALFSHDFRATERLFAQLMQVAGRAGRGGQGGDVLIQTRHPTHPLFQALTRHDYPGFAAASLTERRQAGLPPFIYQALLRAEAKTLEQAMAFLQRATAHFDAVVADAETKATSGHSDAHEVHRFDPVPMALVKIANTFRAQLLIESASRAALQRLLPAWQQALRADQSGVVRWAVEVDPLDI
ncbi:primosomal protein N' [Robbsia sp. KACC 23696]|uniref:replication restart helicase PriA n=1 Tax=Robbsia sp. KACC 23696 TaxID=3149231 RepID=UPI00325A721F